MLTHRFNWKQASMAAALCYGVRGGGAQLAFHVTAGNYDTDTLIQVLGELHRFLGGEKATLLWDGLPAHRSQAMRAWLATQRSWLVTERLPAYAPELNPVEGLWSSLKAVELANLTSPTLAEVIDQAHRGIDRVRRTPHLATRFCAMPACRRHDGGRRRISRFGGRLREYHSHLDQSSGPAARRSGAMTRSLRRVDWAALGANVGSAVLFTLLLSSPFLWGAHYTHWLLGLAIGILLGLSFYVRRDRYSEPGPDADETRFPR